MSKKSLLIALVIILAGVSLFFILRQRGEAPTQEQPTQVVTEEPTTPTESYPQHIEAIPGNTDEVWYNIPELGVRMRLNKSFAEDLIYSNGMTDDFGKYQDGVYFSTKAIAEVAPECAPDRGGAFGVLSKIDGTVEEADRNGLGLDSGWYASKLKLGEATQFPEYFITWSGPQALCEFSVHQGSVQKKWPINYPGLGARNVSDGIKTLELIP